MQSKCVLLPTECILVSTFDLVGPQEDRAGGVGEECLKWRALIACMFVPLERGLAILLLLQHLEQHRQQHRRNRHQDIRALQRPSSVPIEPVRVL